jgi:hypothetical protein
MTVELLDDLAQTFRVFFDDLVRLLYPPRFRRRWLIFIGELFFARLHTRTVGRDQNETLI